MKRTSPAASRNKDPILEVLRRLAPARGRALEVASGGGEHAVWFAQHLPGVTWQPSDADPDARASIGAWRDEAALPNLLVPVAIDAAADAWDPAGAEPFDLVVCINMVHIAPFTAAEGLFRGASRLLRGAPDAGALVLYGPFRFAGAFTAESNAAFDASLRERDPAWGVRDVVDLDRLGAAVGLAREATFELPVNNHCLVYRAGSRSTSTGNTGETRAS